MVSDTAFVPARSIAKCRLAFENGFCRGVLPLRPHCTHPPVGPFRCGRCGSVSTPPILLWREGLFCHVRAENPGPAYPLYATYPSIRKLVKCRVQFPTGPSSTHSESRPSIYFIIYNFIWRPSMNLQPVSVNTPPSSNPICTSLLSHSGTWYLLFISMA
jgi:hypothetical protein